jgi:hypothetical protein
MEKSPATFVKGTLSADFEGSSGLFSSGTRVAAGRGASTSDGVILTSSFSSFSSSRNLYSS